VFGAALLKSIRYGVQFKTMWNFKSLRFVVASLFIEKDVEFQGGVLSGIIVGALLQIVISLVEGDCETDFFIQQ